MRSAWFATLTLKVRTWWPCLVRICLTSVPSCALTSPSATDTEGGSRVRKPLSSACWARVCAQGGAEAAPRGAVNKAAVTSAITPIARSGFLMSVTSLISLPSVRKFCRCQRLVDHPGEPCARQQQPLAHHELGGLEVGGIEHHDAGGHAVAGEAGIAIGH